MLTSTSRTVDVAGAASVISLAGLIFPLNVVASSSADLAAGPRTRSRVPPVEPMAPTMRRPTIARRWLRAADCWTDGLLELMASTVRGVSGCGDRSDDGAAA